ncbi:MAG: hypothetical protein SFT81_00025 [Candidatus Caenarcaniphilales bacterium]|nr:hypothetical protein [Candidatus Caenarcaniphilales bacterium]
MSIIIFKKVLEEFDREQDYDLEACFASISEKSTALALSLKRCFEQARSSDRFQEAYRLAASTNFTEIELLKRLVNQFEAQDYLIFREFVRLLRACSLHISGEISGKIKAAYLEAFKGKRLWIAYQAGKGLH